MSIQERALKHFGLAFLFAVVFYVVVYWGIEAFRPRKGPWEVTFTAKAREAPEIVINQFRLGITNVAIVFPGAAGPTNQLESVTIRFNEAKATPFALPFGSCIFLDTTFLPGTVTMRFFGHEIELLPRVMVVDHLEHRWKPGDKLSLPAKGRH